MPKVKLVDAGLALLVILAAYTAGLATLAERRSRATDPSRGSPLPNWELSLQQGRILGTAGAQARMAIFSDFDCSFCRTLALRIDTLLEAGAQIEVRFLHYPITGLHPQAERAAIAAECAGQLGRFKPYHDVLFADLADDARDGDLTRMAASVGIADTSRFSACLADSTAAQAVQKDVILGREFGLTGTPAIVISGRLYRGAQSVKRLRELLQLP
jgi:protein-disulfide isomerase